MASDSPASAESNSASLPSPSADFTGLWAKSSGGVVSIRWRNVLAYVAAFFAMQILVVSVLSWLVDVPFSLLAIATPLFGMLAYLVVVVELQRQRARHGEWRFQLGLASWMVLVTLFCLFAGLFAHNNRQVQEWQATNKVLEQKLKAVMGEGVVAMGNVDGRMITCQVERTTFSDDDLRELIRIASRDRARPCELTGMFLGKTKVTSKGVEELASSGRLTILELPAIPLSTEAIDALATCKRLNFLFLDEKLLSSEQLAKLKSALPRLKLNGRAW